MPDLPDDVDGASWKWEEGRAVLVGDHVGELRPPRFGKNREDPGPDEDSSDTERGVWGLRSLGVSSPGTRLGHLPRQARGRIHIFGGSTQVIIGAEMIHTRTRNGCAKKGDYRP